MISFANPEASNEEETVARHPKWRARGNVNRSHGTRPRLSAFFHSYVHRPTEMFPIPVLLNYPDSTFKTTFQSDFASHPLPLRIIARSQSAPSKEKNCGDTLVPRHRLVDPNKIASFMSILALFQTLSAIQKSQSEKV